MTRRKVDRPAASLRFRWAENEPCGFFSLLAARARKEFPCMLRINELNALRGAKPRRSRISVHDLPFNCELKSPAQGGLGVLDGPRADARSPSDFIQISTCLGLSSIRTTPSPGAIFLLDVVPIILPSPKCNAAFALVNSRNSRKNSEREDRDSSIFRPFFC